MKMIRYELSRAFTTLGFKLSILIGAIIALSHFLLEGLPLALKLEEYVARNKGMIYPGWLYSQWMGGNSSSIQSFLYFLILPLLAALPYADSFYSDATGGYLGELCTRVHRVHYLIGKYIAVFLSGAIAAVFPLILNFLLSSFVYPAMKPEAALEISHLPAVSLSELYYSHPLVFWMIHIAMVFMISGLFAVFALSASFFLNYQFMAMVSPFILYTFLIAIFSLLDLPNWQPNNFLDPAYSNIFNGDILTPCLVTGTMLFAVSFFFFIRGKRDDII